MNTKVVTIKEDHIDEEAIQEAGLILKDGGLVAFPTETVYGPVSYTHLTLPTKLEV